MARDDCRMEVRVTQTNRLIVRLQVVVLLCLLALAVLSACAGRKQCATNDQPRKGKYETITMEVTAYSSDQESTNWRRGRILFWRAYVASGPNKGKRKIVGLTSSGTWARYGTIAADTRYYPYGTVMIIPGYGKGVVEDIGGAIKGPRRLDVYFKTRRRALRWGRQTLPVRVRR